MNYAETWNAIRDYLIEHADYIGVDSGEIHLGRFQEGEEGVTVAPPGLVVYIEPGDFLLLSETAQIPLCATCTIVAIAALSADTTDRICNAIDIAIRAWLVMRKAEETRAIAPFLFWPRRPVRLDTVTAEATSAVVQFVTSYDHPPFP